MFSQEPRSAYFRLCPIAVRCVYIAITEIVYSIPYIDLVLERFQEVSIRLGSEKVGRYYDSIVLVVVMEIAMSEITPLPGQRSYRRTVQYCTVPAYLPTYLSTCKCLCHQK